MTLTSLRGMALAALGVLASACAQIPPNQSLPPDNKAHLKNTEVVVGIKQSEIYAAINPSNFTAAAGGGLLLALIDVGVNQSRTSDAEAVVRPLRDALLGFDFDQPLRLQLATQSARTPLLGRSEVRVVRDVSDKNYATILAASRASAVWFVNADYHVSADFSTLTASLRGLLYPVTLDAMAIGDAAAKARINTQQRTALENALYRGTVSYEARLPALAKTPEGNTLAWAANHGALAREALTQAIEQLGALLASDLRAPLAATAEEVKLGAQIAHVVARSRAGTTLRLPDGSLQYIATLTPLADTAAAPAPP